jgi:hypothetical protein
MALSEQTFSGDCEQFRTRKVGVYSRNRAMVDVPVFLDRLVVDGSMSFGAIQYPLNMDLALVE